MGREREENQTSTQEGKLDRQLGQRKRDLKE